MLVNLSVGMLTPPVGLNLFVAMGVAKMTLFEVFRAALPTILLMVSGAADPDLYPGVQPAAAADAVLAMAGAPRARGPSRAPVMPKIGAGGGTAIGIGRKMLYFLSAAPLR